MPTSSQVQSNAAQDQLGVVKDDGANICSKKGRRNSNISRYNKGAKALDKDGEEEVAASE